MRNNSSSSSSPFFSDKLVGKKVTPHSVRLSNYHKIRAKSDKKLIKELTSQCKYGKKFYYRKMAKSNWADMSGMSGGRDMNTYSRYSVPLSKEVLKEEIVKKEQREVMKGKGKVMKGKVTKGKGKGKGNVTTKGKKKVKGNKENDKFLNNFTFHLDFKIVENDVENDNKSQQKKKKKKSKETKGLSEGFFKDADGVVYHYIGKSLYRYNGCII